MDERRSKKEDRKFKAHFFFFALIFLTAFICVIAHLVDDETGGNSGGKELAKGDLPKTTAAVQATGASVTSVTTVTTVTTTAATNKGVPKSQAKSEEYLKSCAFVGDSITVGLSSYQFLPAENVIAEVGVNVCSVNEKVMQTAYGDMTALEALMHAVPDNIYVMLGSNGISWLSVDSMVADYSAFVDSIRRSLPKANIYLVSIPPVTAAKEKSDQPIFNSDIDEYNKHLLDLAVKNKYYYIDLNADLKDDSGVFPVEDAADDGMHFNRSTYEKMINFILTHVA